MNTDFLIKGALVYDGTGANPKLMEIGISSGKIAAVAAKLDGMEAAETIDARGMALSPGFIDVHSHDDFFVLMTPDMEYKTKQGVTTTVVGNCGFSIAPFERALEHTLFYYDRSRLPAWTDFLSYFKCLKDNPPAINVSVLAGHGCFRYTVNRFSEKPLDNAEVKEVVKLVEGSLDQGVNGISLGLAYFPGRYTDTRELRETIKVLKSYNSLFAIHMRDEGHELIQAIREALQISSVTGVPVHISHFKAFGRKNYHLMEEALEITDSFHGDTGLVTVDLYPYDSGATALKEIIKWGVFSKKGKESFSLKPSDVVILSSEKDPHLIGRNLDYLSELYRLSPEEAAIKATREEENIVVGILNNISEQNIEAILKKPYSMIGSDGIPTKTGFTNPRLYGTFPRLLGRYCREKKVLKFEEAIHKMTGLPAARFRLKNRGVIREGAFADITIFDPGLIADKGDYSNPKQYPVGIRDVFVNGAMVIKNGTVTGRRPGLALRG